MPFPQVVAVAASSPAERAGIAVGDSVVSLNGVVPRDVIEYQLLSDEALLELEFERGGERRSIRIDKEPGEPLGLEVSSALFDRVRTCDNHCSFCFIYQLPKGMRKSLYVKDDDYRLSFLYGNFTTLTRFTEADLERVITERLSPLYVSIHATDPDVRASLLRNRRGAISLRWLSALLDAGIEVHGQIVVCPGVNDAEVLEDTLAGVLESYRSLQSIACVPLGISRFSHEETMRPHTFAEANAVLDTVERWQERFLRGLGRRLVYASDEYYLLAGRPFPEEERYDSFNQSENGIGMAREFILEFEGAAHASGRRTGFFQSVDGAPAQGYRARPLLEDDDSLERSEPDEHAPVTVITSRYGEAVLHPLLQQDFPDVELLVIENAFFGGNTAVAGLMTGEDLQKALSNADPSRRYLLPDVCLNEGRFLDGVLLEELPHRVEVIETNGTALRHALSQPTRRARRRISLAIS